MYGPTGGFLAAKLLTLLGGFDSFWGYFELSDNAVRKWAKTYGLI
jgi:hypothetical protein